jgi:hypothetical protein
VATVVAPETVLAVTVVSEGNVETVNSCLVSVASVTAVSVVIVGLDRPENRLSITLLVLLVVPAVVTVARAVVAAVVVLANSVVIGALVVVPVVVATVVVGTVVIVPAVALVVVGLVSTSSLISPARVVVVGGWVVAACVVETDAYISASESPLFTLEAIKNLGRPVSLTSLSIRAASSSAGANVTVASVTKTGSVVGGCVIGARVVGGCVVGASVTAAASVTTTGSALNVRLDTALSASSALNPNLLISAQ